MKTLNTFFDFQEIAKTSIWSMYPSKEMSIGALFKEAYVFWYYKKKEKERDRERETESKRKGERGNESESTWPSLQPFYIIKICRKDCAAVDSHENACELGCVQD